MPSATSELLRPYLRNGPTENLFLLLPEASLFPSSPWQGHCRAHLPAQKLAPCLHPIPGGIRALKVSFLRLFPVLQLSTKPSLFGVKFRKTGWEPVLCHGESPLHRQLSIFVLTSDFSFALLFSHLFVRITSIESL